MRHILIKTTSMALALTAMAACSEAEFAEQDSADMQSAVAEAMADEAMAPDARAAGDLTSLGGRPEIPITLPQMAYVYDYGFRLPGENIATLQQRHADMCEAEGPYTCQILSMSHSGGEDRFATGRLELAVAADRARAFAGRLSGTLEAAEGEQVAANISGEDLSKRIVDTEARLRSRIALRDRLMDVLRTRQGDLDDLVAAERQVAQINEEIDQARSWMEEMRGRVAYSRVNLDYRTATPPASDFLDPVRSAFGALGGILGNILAVLIVLGAVVVPFGAMAVGGRSIWRRMRPSQAEAG